MKYDIEYSSEACIIKFTLLAKDLNVRYRNTLLLIGIGLSYVSVNASAVGISIGISANAAVTAGNAFRAKNKTRKGVVTLANGIQYEILKKGTGPKPTITDSVTVHYHGTLITGKVFDSSVTRGQPATFPVGRVIKGWQIIVPMMPIGSKWKVVIPPELAYGDRGAGALIGPGTTLIFEIELISIAK